MRAERLSCESCGEGLNPLMRTCPRCGKEITPKRSPSSEVPNIVSAATSESGKEVRPSSALPQPGRAKMPEPPPVSPEPPPPFIPAPRRPVIPKTIPLVPAQDFVYLSPGEKLPRLPRFTQHQMILFAAGFGLVIFGVIIALLLWNQHRREQARLAENRATEQSLLKPASPPLSATDPALNPNPLPLDDKALAETVRTALAVYNPVAAATRYKFQVQDGIVTLDGYAFNQPEKDGAENVIRAIAGIKMLCSNLVISPTVTLPPVMSPISDVQARRFDDALLKLLQNQNPEQAAGQQPEPPRPGAASDPQREAERERREQELARSREEEAALRRQETERLQREAAEYERRQEEQRRAEAERRARAAQARAEAGALRSGTVAWSGLVDGVDEIIISGSSASVRHLSGDPAREARVSFSAPIPRAPVTVKLISSTGRGPISIVQEPSAANGYTTIVRVDDSSKGGDKRYEFTLRWSAQ